MKVYCKDCCYLSCRSISTPVDDVDDIYCKKVLNQYDTPYEILEKKIVDYNKQNKKNDCKYYKQKWKKLMCLIRSHKFKWKTIKVEKFDTLDHITEEGICTHCKKVEYGSFIKPKDGYDDDPDKMFYPYTTVC